MVIQTDLNVILWVPVRVVDDDGVGSSQIDTQSPSSGAQEEHKSVCV